MAEVFIPVAGRVQGDVARDLLAAAAELGMPARVVRSTVNGYLVPPQVADHVTGSDTDADDAPPSPKRRTPRKTAPRKAAK